MLKKSSQGSLLDFLDTESESTTRLTKNTTKKSSSKLREDLDTQHFKRTMSKIAKFAYQWVEKSDDY